jgi:hypothetical protein
VRGAAVPQPHQRHLVPGGQLAGDVGELAAVAHVHRGQLRPLRLAAYQQVIRARIVRDAAHGYANQKIAARQRDTSTPCATGAAATPKRACPD